MKKIRPKLTYSNVIATIALFLALGGSAWAAIGKNSVKTRNIAPGAVTNAKLAKNAVTKHKIAEKAVTARAIGPGAILPGALGIGSVGTSALGAFAVNAGKIANNSVTNPKLASNAVTEPKIAADAVTGAKIDESTLGQVPDARLFDGLASTKVMKTDRFGRTRVDGGTTAGGATTAGIASFIDTTGALDFTCAPGLKFTLRNTGAAPMTVWTQTDGSPALVTAVPAGGSFNPDSDGAPTNGDGWIDWQILTGTTLIRMTSTAVAVTITRCDYATYYQEITLGAP